MNVFDLVASITLDSSEYDSALNDTSNKTKTFGQKLGSGLKTAGKVGAVALGAVATAGTVVAKSFWNGAQELAEYGDNIDKMSQKMGISAEAYQEWDAVMQHSGTSIDGMKRGMTTLAQQAEKGAEEFEKLGISQEELASMSQEDLFAKTIEGLQNMESGTERTVLAQKLLGGSAKELGALLNTSAEDTQKMKDRVHELGGVMSDEAVKAAAAFQDNMKDLGTAISGVKRGIIDDFLPAANDMISGFTSLIAGEEGAEEQIDSGLNKMVDAAGKALDRFSELGETIFPKIGEAITKMLPKLLELGSKIALQLADGIIQNLPSLVGSLISGLTDILNVIATDIAPKIPDVAIELVTTVVDSLLDNLDMIIDAGLKIVLGLADGLLKAVPKLVAKIPEIITKLVNALLKSIPKIVDAGVKLLTSITNDLPKIINGITKALPDIIKGIVNALIENLPMIIEAGVKLFTALVENLPAIIENILTAIPEIIGAILGALAELSPELAALFEGAWELITAIWNVAVDFFTGIWEGIVGVFEGIGEWFSGVFQGAYDLVTGIWDAASGFFSGVWEGITGALSGVIDWFSSIFQGAYDAVTGIWDAITGFFSGVWETIVGIFKDAGVAVGDAISGAVKGAVNAVLRGATGIINGFIKAINVAISVINAIPGVKISKLSLLDAPQLAKGGILEKGEIGFLEGTGAEAVVPLDQNRKWVRAVAQEFRAQGGGTLAGAGGDIVIPVYIGDERIQDVVVKAQQLAQYRTGGR